MHFARPRRLAKGFRACADCSPRPRSSPLPVTLTHADEGEKTVLGGLLSKALSTPGSRVAIGAVDGALSSDATIRDVAISDATASG